MIMETSPTKRRALGPVDINSRSPSTLSKFQMSKSQFQPFTSDEEVDCRAAKRPLDLDLDPKLKFQHHSSPQPAKRQRVSVGEEDQPLLKRVEHEEGRVRVSRISLRDDDSNGVDSDSPDESSLLDNSAMDTSQATVITEPDVEGAAPTPPAPPRRQLSMSREEARRKAELLRLRLGLASYKVRTGQTDVPLDQLKMKPMFSRAGLRQNQQPSLPPLLPPPSNVGLGARGTVGNRPSSAGRKPLPVVPPSHRRAVSSGHVLPRAERMSAPELSRPSSNPVGSGR
ncbi:hypothetical protein M426DRAFT_200464 [Hypoxylon sp. CI-4A]|nr:hypothetical protein M426DRAFT_200464 [Hypoxylon sp. CI-4A]